MDAFAKWALGILSTLIVGFVAYWGRRVDTKHQDHEERIQKLEAREGIVLSRLESMDKKLDLLLAKELK